MGNGCITRQLDTELLERMAKGWKPTRRPAKNTPLETNRRSALSYRGARRNEAKGTTWGPDFYDQSFTPRRLRAAYTVRPNKRDWDASPKADRARGMPLFMMAIAQRLGLR